MKCGITSTGQMANNDRLQIEVVTTHVSVANVWAGAESEGAYGRSYEWFEQTDCDFLYKCYQAFVRLGGS